MTPNTIALIFAGKLTIVTVLSFLWLFMTVSALEAFKGLKPKERG